MILRRLTEINDRACKVVCMVQAKTISSSLQSFPGGPDLAFNEPRAVHNPEYKGKGAVFFKHITLYFARVAYGDDDVNAFV